MSSRPESLSLLAAHYGNKFAAASGRSESRKIKLLGPPRGVHAIENERDEESHQKDRSAHTQRCQRQSHAWTHLVASGSTPRFDYADRKNWINCS